ncbi:MAG: DMT family transporter [Succinivibrio dextrinosolvens]|uniref:DMT family transporter n=1 Tax=Succinivibrio sp. TaxID=2053619 RepID=UPI0025D5128E|nr:DMT family transporter [Succinivibrio sp.]MDY6416360.1 DMT family transporter [Succinivibrio dextrinosolvens]MBQ9221372.1 DMT family transporter [Succinivibrio sp.]MDY6420404.1 DMT family transporter [Succinivibrio dextrinosolvens]MDY6465557.1 DMT family transporter [Succinivibrio dextrinosolvens]MDY6470319.1 DMT family transporter [Succinivibrio dextrinosolvens]
MLNGKFKYYLILLLACFIWGATPLCGRVLRDSMSPMLITAARFYVVALILFSLILILHGKKGILVSRHDLKILFIMSVVGIFLHNSLLFEGLRYTPASNAAIIESIGPSVTSILAFFFIGERLSSSGWLGILVSCFGAIFIVCKGSFNTLVNFEFNIGELLVLVCEIMWSVYVIISWRLSANISALVVTAYTGLFGATLCLITGLCLDSLHVYRFTLSDAGYFFVLSVFAGVVSFASWNYAIARVGASKGSTFIYLVPVFGVMFGVFLLDELFSLYEFVGALFVVVGMFFSIRAKTSTKQNRRSIKDLKQEIIQKQKMKKTS